MVERENREKRGRRASERQEERERERKLGRKRREERVSAVQTPTEKSHFQFRNLDEFHPNVEGRPMKSVCMGIERLLEQCPE